MSTENFVVRLSSKGGDKTDASTRPSASIAQHPMPHATMASGDYRSATEATSQRMPPVVAPRPPIPGSHITGHPSLQQPPHKIAPAAQQQAHGAPRPQARPVYQHARPPVDAASRPRGPHASSSQAPKPTQGMTSAPRAGMPQPATTAAARPASGMPGAPRGAMVVPSSIPRMPAAGVSAKLPVNETPRFQFDGCHFDVSTVVAAVSVKPAPQQKYLRPNKPWDDALRCMFPHLPTLPPTYCEPVQHPARAVNFGHPRNVVLIYPNGRLVAYGHGYSEAYMLELLVLTIKLLRLVINADVNVDSESAMPTVESIIVTCSGCEPLNQRLASDMLFLDKMAVRHGRKYVEYVPEVCPAALIRPLTDTNMSSGHAAVDRRAAIELPREFQATASSGHTASPLVSLFESGKFVISHCNSRDQVLDAYWAFKHRFVLSAPPDAVTLPRHGSIFDIPPRPSAKVHAPADSSTAPSAAPTTVQSPATAAGDVDGSGAASGSKRPFHVAFPTPQTDASSVIVIT